MLRPNLRHQLQVFNHFLATGLNATIRDVLRGIGIDVAHEGSKRGAAFSVSGWVDHISLEDNIVSEGRANR